MARLRNRRDGLHRSNVEKNASRIELENRCRSYERIIEEQQSEIENTTKRVPCYERRRSTATPSESTISPVSLLQKKTRIDEERNRDSISPCTRA